MPLPMLPNKSNSSAAFGKKVSSYEAHAFVQAHAADWLAQWLPQERKPARCLEFGSGTGLLTRHLHRQFDHLEASDIEPGMVELCRKKFPHVTHSVRDAWTEQEEIEHWDIVATSSVLQWASKPQIVMNNWRKLLKTNGRILAGFFIHPSLPELLTVTGVGSPLKWRNATDWEKIFHTAGFEIVRMEEDTRRYHYDTALDFWKSLHGTGTAVSRKIPPSQMMRFFREYELQFRDAKGVYATWTFCRAELKALS